MKKRIRLQHTGLSPQAVAHQASTTHLMKKNPAVGRALQAAAEKAGVQS